MEFDTTSARKVLISANFDVSVTKVMSVDECRWGEYLLDRPDIHQRLPLQRIVALHHSDSARPHHQLAEDFPALTSMTRAGQLIESSGLLSGSVQPTRKAYG
ncbi:hypothetical protein ACQP2U_21200 [Nocardia sp. CA-084685]|uniref:hypothetical protein n=1 Tax=Nocardia sp. CA-084685 TaxID=3239970 RepID=UPI003D9613EA